MVRAAVRRTFDFDAAEPDNRLWWIKLKAVIEETLREDEVDAIRSDLATVEGLLSCVHLNPAKVKELLELHSLMSDSIHDSLRPWDKRGDQRRRKIETLTETYERQIGDLKDPAVRKRFDDEAKALMRLLDRVGGSQ